MGVKEKDERLEKIAKAEGGLKGDSEDKPQRGSSPWLVRPWLGPTQQPPQQLARRLFPWRRLAKKDFVPNAFCDAIHNCRLTVCPENSY
jgi:hypothetical protein